MNKMKCCNIESISGIVFAFIAILHLIRVIFGWTVTVGAMELGMGLSVVIVIITGLLAILNFRKCRCDIKKLKGDGC